MFQWRTKSDSDTQRMSAVRAGKVRPSTVAICCDTGLLQGHGLNGAKGVFRSWNKVASLVMGVSKAVFKRCDNYDKAQEFVEVSRACVEI
jgi:hypothetical protein